MITQRQTRSNVPDTLEMRVMAKKLVSAGVSATAQRLLIADVLLNKSQHLSADQVLNLVNKEMSVVSKATVYNTLGLFARKGLVKEVIVDPARVFYDSNVTHHYHMFNADDGTLSDVESADVRIEQALNLPENIELDAVDIIFRVKNRY